MVTLDISFTSILPGMRWGNPSYRSICVLSWHEHRINCFDSWFKKHICINKHTYAYTHVIKSSLPKRDYYDKPRVYLLSFF